MALRLSGLRNSRPGKRSATGRKHSKLKDIFHKRNGQLALGGNGSAIELIERHKQRTHFAIQPLKQEPTDVFRHFETTQSGAKLKRLELVFIRQRLQLVDLPPVKTRSQIRQAQLELARRSVANPPAAGCRRADR